MDRRTCSIVVTLALMAGTAWPQSMGAAAEREKKRREERKVAGVQAKVLTLDNWQGWQTFQPTEADFSVQFPAKPQASEDLLTLPEARLYQRVFKVSKENVGFAVATADFGSTPYERLPKDTLIKQIAGAGFCSPISLGSHPGCETQRVGVGNRAAGELPADITSRIFVVQRRVYVVTYVRVRDGGPPAESPEPFFSSFAVKP